MEILVIIGAVVFLVWISRPIDTSRIREMENDQQKGLDHG